MEVLDENKLAKRKKQQQAIAFWVLRILSYSIVAILFVILSFIIYKGASSLSWDFITKMPEEGMTKGGIFPAIIGTLCLVAGSMIFAFPIGVLAAIYM
jgi:phosphate transport system permease protein